jgi:hypothetical protein
MNVIQIASGRLYCKIMGVLKDLHGGERELLVSVHIQMA